jgi:GT2 family glycosyltransferase
MKRWDYLRAAVASVASQTVPVQETVVVIDHEPDLLDRAQHELDDVTVVANVGHRGASGARNTGVAGSCGEMVAFLDDDAVAEPAWLEVLLRHFAQPEVIGVGGRLEPLWESPRPRWFPPEFAWTVGASYLGMPLNAGPVRNVWSVNMVIRREVFQAINGFREGFGKVGGRPSPEDTDLCLRASAVRAGMKWVYDPAGVVAHRVPAQRATLRYFLHRCYHEGRGKALLTNLNGARESIREEHLYVRRTLSHGVLHGLREAVRGDIYGAGRSLAIVIGLTFAAYGFLAAQAAHVIKPALTPRRRSRTEPSEVTLSG